MLHKTPSIPSDFGQTLLPERRGQIPLQEQDLHPTRHSVGGRLPWPCAKDHQGQEDQRQYLVRFKNQTANKDKWFAEDAIPDGNLHLRKLRGSRRAKQSHKL
ncbi:hypothetical protein O181_092831 [Austropuccinia psidii MF-1]|uniref:Uncharacterized protein n=1 Tax=Austropuccinia psidii MF-1 TaxID=1389203 RepID=A0A9Q3PB06_9BASI|nr:hypothetical protein [Austropuccinia psidii MF-1]